MYRNRLHLSVSDLDGWNTALDVVVQVNAIAARLELPQARVWTESFGPYNQLTFEIDYESLAAYEQASAALYADPEMLGQMKRLHEVTTGAGYSEMCEDATPVGAGASA